ncbi:hypothetical protein [Tumebacillus flagellatus]|uniref:Uncharacterized protein n=1 Tax=Tumebacillus flagellatus TaxID=1157490 RepID=A0A074LPF1_9BACL|nr:hypothetical protein [Tumebacillus flagellatus]KEO81708.1 hypothetical protein EL26_19015 [Tumebacillus flagellatus]
MKYKQYVDYAMHRGKEYELSSDPNTGDYMLLSSDPETQCEGFVPRGWLPGEYKKVVKTEEVESVYRYTLYALYRGLQFEVENIKDGIAFLIHNGLEGSNEAVAIGFKFADRWYFEKHVPMEDIEELRLKAKPNKGFVLPTAVTVEQIVQFERWPDEER